MTRKITIGKYILEVLKANGVDDIFGIPGDYILDFFNEILKSDINYVATCNELNAAYAADAYAKLKGIGSLCVTYAVGELSAINGVAGAWAEDVPVVFVAGWPQTASINANLCLHHTLEDYKVPLNMYKNITIAQTLINDPSKAYDEINRVVQSCLANKKPVYLGLCMDLTNTEIEIPDTKFTLPKELAVNTYSNTPVDPQEILDQAITETIAKIENAERPLIIPGLALMRFHLEKEGLSIIENSGLPYATFFMGKCIYPENHPQHIGVYFGDLAFDKSVRDLIDNTDCALILGEKPTDYNTGVYTSNLKKKNTILVSAKSVTIGHCTYDVKIEDFVPALAEKIPYRKTSITMPPEAFIHKPSKVYTPQKGKQLTIHRFFDKMAQFIPENAIIIVDTGTAMFSLQEVLLPKGVTIIQQAYYGSIGYSVGGTLGCCLAQPNRPVLAFFGDGAFQVTCQELSTIIRNKCTPLIILFNNDGYTIERIIQDNLYNDLQMWNYSQLPQAFGYKGKTYKCLTEDDLEEAVNDYKWAEEFRFVEVVTDRWDCAQSLKDSGKMDY